MLPSRFAGPSSSSIRKSRLEGKQSFLPKPRRPGSMERMSVEMRRPSNARSSSAEPPRATLGVARLSREASATKIPLNKRSRSHQTETDKRYGQVSMTPLRSSNFSRPTTPVRTPSEDRSTRSWQASLDRAIASVTIKDNRPIQTVAWQRAEMARVQEALAARGGGGDGCNNMALMRPLTITRFVDITGSLLTAVTKDTKLNNDNYVTKLLHTTKRLLYPGNVSKSWLRTVNTLHAFPQALALMSYLIDLVAILEAPMNDELLYVDKDDLACLRRDYLYKCWIRFQEPVCQFDDINNEYLQQLELLLGNDEEKIAELEQIINEQRLCLEDAAEAAARAGEARRADTRAALLAALRAEHGARAAAAAAARDARTRARALLHDADTLDVEVERASVESQQLKRELDEQSMTVTERIKLLEEIDYANRVIDSKQILAQQISKMILSKETELALWQKKTLDSCVEYKQGLIHLSAAYPDLAQLAIEEKELMGAGCGRDVSAALEVLKQRHAELMESASARERTRQSDKRRRAQKLTEVRTALSEVRANLEREQKALEDEQAREAGEAAAWAAGARALAAGLDAVRARHHDYAKADNDLLFWEKQNHIWMEKLSGLREYITTQRQEAETRLEAARTSRANLVLETVAKWNKKLDLISQ